MPADASHEPPEWDDLFLGDHVLEVTRGSVQRHLLDGLSRLAGVLRITREHSFRRRSQEVYGFHTAFQLLFSSRVPFFIHALPAGIPGLRREMVRHTRKVSMERHVVTISLIRFVNIY